MAIMLFFYFVSDCFLLYHVIHSTTMGIVICHYVLWYFSLPFYQCYRYLNQYWLSVICRIRLALRGSLQLRLISVKRLA